MQRLENLYSSNCAICGKPHLPNLAADEDWTAILDNIAMGLFSEQYENGYIHPDLFKKTAAQLTAAMLNGLGGLSFAYNDERNLYKAYLEQNIYKFSAAKTLTQMLEFRSYMTNGVGKREAYPAFRAKVAQSGALFNNTWLQTEYDTADMSAIMAGKWIDLTATNDYLEYSTVGDNRVRPEHAKLDKLTLHKDSPVWNRIYPPCDWGCRCTVVPGIASRASTDSEGGKLGKDAVTNPLFDNNVGKSKLIFKDDHPYFKNALGKISELDAVKNYGLKTPEQIFNDTSKLPASIELDSSEDYLAWWRKELKKIPDTDDVVLKDSVNNNVLFDSNIGKAGNEYDYFKLHILKKTAEKRYEYAANFPDVIQQPNEIWSNIQNGKLVNFYIKYYQDKACVVVVKDSAGMLKADSMYSLTMDRLKQIRRGVLRFEQ